MLGAILLFELQYKHYIMILQLISEKTNLSFISCHIKQKWHKSTVRNDFVTNKHPSSCNKVKLTPIECYALHHTGIVLALSQHRHHWASLSLHNVRQQQNGGLALQIFTQSQSDFRPHLFNAIFLLASPREGIKASLGPVKASLRGLGEWLRLSCASLCWRSLHRVDALQMPVLFSSLNAGLYRWACMLSYQLGPEEGSLCWLHHGLWVEKTQELTTHCEVAKVNIKHCSQGTV